MKNIVCMLGLALAVPTFAGCAEDPNKQVKTAQAEEAEAVREGREKRAEDRADVAVERAENRKDATEDRADKLPKGTSDRVAAEAGMTAEREKFRARASEKLDKAQARIAEAKRKMEISKRATLDDKSKVEAAFTQHQTVAKEVDSLKSVSDDQWKDSTASVDRHLDELDALVETASKKADALKK